MSLSELPTFGVEHSYVLVVSNAPLTGLTEALPVLDGSDTLTSVKVPGSESVKVPGISSGAVEGQVVPKKKSVAKCTLIKGTA